MLNKRQKYAICILIGQWKYNNMTSSPAAFASAECAEEIISLFNLSEEDLTFGYQSAIFDSFTDSNDMDLYEAFLNYWDIHGRSDVDDMIDKPENFIQILNDNYMDDKEDY